MVLYWHILGPTPTSLRRGLIMVALRGRLIMVLVSAMTLSLSMVGPMMGRNIGEEGCTPGFWKNHTADWQEYTPTTTLGDLFDFPASLSAFADDSLLDGLQGDGGPGLTGGAEILLRAGVAAHLNAAHEGVGYPYRRFAQPGPLSGWINDALASEDRDTMLELAETLDNANNLGCPLGESEAAQTVTRRVGPGPI